MKKSLFLLLILAACGTDKTYIVGEDAFCSGLEETSTENVFCVDANDKPINGMVIEYFENGNILREMTIRDGRENGIEREYYEDGKLRVETNVRNSNADGLSKIYNPDGKIYMEIRWDNGTAVDIKVYDDDGNTIVSKNDMN